MEPLTPESFEALYPVLKASVEAKLRSENQDPEDFVLTGAYHSEDRVEASYYPQAIADAHAAGTYTVPNYLWLAVDAVLMEGELTDLNIRLLEDGGWVG